MIQGSLIKGSDETWRPNRTQMRNELLYGVHVNAVGKLHLHTPTIPLEYFRMNQYNHCNVSGISLRTVTANKVVNELNGASGAACVNEGHAECYCSQ